MPETLNKAPIAIVDEDRSPLSVRISGAFYLPYFTPPALITQEEMDARMDVGARHLRARHPARFPARRAARAAARDPAQRRRDPHDPGVHRQRLRPDHRRGRGAGVPRAPPRRAPAPVELDVRVRFNPKLTKSWFGGVMELINQVTMLAIMLTGAALIREREHGTIEHLLVMPVTPFEIMTAKIWANGLVVLVVCGLSLVVRGPGPAGGADRGLDRAVPRRRRAAPVRDDLARHLPRHDRPLDAAVRAAVP